MERQRELIRLNYQLNAAGLLGVVGVLAAVWFFGLRSARQESVALAYRQSQLQRFLETETLLAAEFQSRQAALVTQRQETEQLLDRIPTDSREADFLQLLSDTAEQSGVTLQNFQPLSSLVGEHIGTTQVRISGRGPYQNLVEFLDRLRQTSRMNRVSRFELGVADASRNVCSIELTLDLFFNVQAFEPPSVAG